MWPGDVNNNGIVNHIDLLYLGNAIGTVGPARMDASVDWQGQEITSLWAETFPDGVNYAYADCDGNGVIDEEDFFTAIEINYGLTHGTVMPDDFDLGVPGVSSPLFFAGVSDPIVEGTPVFIPINLGTESQPIEDFYGIAFTVRYDSDVVNVPLFGFFFPDTFDENWFELDTEEPLFSFQPNPFESKVEIAVTRTDGVPAPSNFGNFGSLFIVIIDNVVGLGADQISTPIYIEDIKLLNEVGESTSVVADSIELTIYNDDLINDTEDVLREAIEVYPNPVNEILTIASKGALIQQIELFDVTGQRVASLPELSNQKINFPTVYFPAGLYHLNIETTDGWLRKKLIIEH
jgi:hypothetical protein